ncbi:MAG TPA: S46 family peptidase [Thermoanaerobaculia bacterium]|nr:S46 family peptidase [Thermoanaerobaculia bacterium]
MTPHFRSAVLLFTAFVLLAIPSSAPADEGQWPPEALATLGTARWGELSSRGLNVTAKDLWDGQGGGLLTAVLGLTGCTGVLVSEEGLFLTNHHCAFSAIQLASTPEKNYLRDGFVARTRAEEVEARGGVGQVRILSRLVDVTDRVRGPKSAFAKATGDTARYEAGERAKKEIVAECEKTPDRRCAVAAFEDGRTFRLMEQIEFRDVRLVYAPPRGVGDFGGEEDNFRWPRHTGDFTVLRVYVSPDGKPAPFSKENVPYRPKSWLKVASKGVAEGDVVMIAGYPGRTQRYLTPSAVTNQEKWFYPLRGRTFSDLIAILEAEGKKDPDTALRVASAIKSYGNGETNARGQIEGLARNGVAARAEAEAKELAEFLASRKSLPAEWAVAPAELEKVLAADRTGQDRRFFLEEIEKLTSVLGSALSAVRRADERRKPDLDREAGYQDRDLDRARQREKDLTRSLAPAAARKALAYLVTRTQAASRERPVRAFDDAFGKGATAEEIEAKLSEMDAATALGDEKVRLANVDATFAALAASNDPYVKLAAGLNPDLTAIRAARKETNGALLVWRPLYLSALEALRTSKGKAIYPDANGTLRVSFATVKGYSPREAVTFTPRTSLRGVLEKESGTEPFATPKKVLDAARAADFGQWADPTLGSVPVGFLTDGDTTGGNSGSPTMNGNGEVVGLNFDRVWENVAGDFGWNPERSRNVNVDLRYALWMMERVDGASALVKELLPPK